MISTKTKEVEIPVDGIKLMGDLIIPKGAKSIVVFSHGSGSSRFSPRNKYVAGMMQEEGLATLMFDLLTQDEDREYQRRFDIELLTERLVIVTGWLKEQEVTQNLEIGYFGSSTGAASALAAAAMLGNTIKAVVSRGGRPDLAAPSLEDVKAPTLFLVGGLDHIVIQLNEQAFEMMNGEKKMTIIPGATHLFEEPGKLELVAHHAGLWFRKYLNKEKISI